VIASEPQPGNTPSGDIAKAKRATSSNDARERRTARVGRSKDASNARAGDERNWDAILLENLKDAEMGESTCEPAAKSQA
jgi:hypothetical protein